MSKDTGNHFETTPTVSGYPEDSEKTDNKVSRSFYIASCVFTSKYPELSQNVQAYIAEKGNIEIVRCCVPKYKLKIFTEKMPESYRDAWSSLPDCAEFQPGDTVYSICHNCSAVLKESKPGVIVKSLWELILEDETFPYPDYAGRELVVQDCWRSRDNRAEQDAVRSLLRKMNLSYLEQAENFEKVDYCGTTLYASCIPRNAVLAPKRFVENAVGKFIPHTEEQQAALMREYAKRFEGQEVVTYCHYCQTGLEIGGAKSSHLAELLFI